MTTCGIVLAGGRSTRMGRDKASLPWDGATMLQAVVSTLRAELPHVIVVAAQGQVLPATGAEVVRDLVPGQGPLRGLATGLAAAAEYEWAFVAATDMPLLSPAVVRLLARPDSSADAVLATADGRQQPLVAAYRTALAGEMESALAAGNRSLLGFLEGKRVRRVAVADAAALLNVNTPEDLGAAEACDPAGYRGPAL